MIRNFQGDDAAGNDEFDIDRCVLLHLNLSLSQVYFICDSGMSLIFIEIKILMRNKILNAIIELIRRKWNFYRMP